MHAAARWIFVIFAIAAGGLRFIKPRENLFEARPRVIRSGDAEPGHQVMIGEAEHGPAVLDLVAPRDAFRARPAPEVVIEVAAGGGARPETPMVNVRAGRRTYKFVVGFLIGEKHA